MNRGTARVDPYRGSTPRIWAARRTRHDHGPIPGVAAIVGARHTDRQSTLLVRTDGNLLDPAWTVHDVTLEDVILTYLADRDGSALRYCQTVRVRLARSEGVTRVNQWLKLRKG